MRAKKTRTMSWFGPDSIEVAARHVRIGEGWAASFAVADYPAEVMAGWLEPLFAYPGRLDVAIHIDPVPNAQAADRLRRQRARLESSRRHGAARERLDDPELEAAAADARELAYRVSCGAGKLFRVGIYLTVHAGSEQELAAEAARVRSLCEGMLLRLVPATFRAVQGWTATLPLGIDPMRIRRTFDTEALATVFPFASPDLPVPSTGGLLLGTNATGSGLVMVDRWALDNHNSVVLARSGAGKSYLTKLEALRSLYQDVQVLVVDPEDEYARLADSVGGTYVALGEPGVRINPLDLPQHSATQSDAVRRRALFVHTVIAVLLGQTLTGAERAVLDSAILSAYAQAGITQDVRTHTRPAPTLKDVAALLAADGTETARSLAERLAPHTTGSFSGLFTGPTTTSAAGHLQVFSLKALPEELKAIGTLLVLDAIWRQVATGPRQRRLVIVDEAWLLMKEPEGAKFLFRMAKAARKHWAGLAVVTQDAADLLGTELGQAVVANAATQILLRQAPQAIDAVASAFRLSAGERGFLLSATRGQGLIILGASARAAFQSAASPAENKIATTDPAELQAMTGHEDSHDGEDDL
ncbi:type IV secretory pathway VirB4 component [Catenulispora sp. GAS73]|uniref:VirB4 family type IV secretion system protein n=1 Tax=Catenulispora sp. GAS73 TaxID=3156269 RepID=UPI0035140761